MTAYNSHSYTDRSEKKGSCSADEARNRPDRRAPPPFAGGGGLVGRGRRGAPRAPAAARFVRRRRPGERVRARRRRGRPGAAKRRRAGGDVFGGGRGRAGLGGGGRRGLLPAPAFAAARSVAARRAAVARVPGVDADEREGTRARRGGGAGRRRGPRRGPGGDPGVGGRRGRRERRAEDRLPVEDALGLHGAGIFDVARIPRPGKSRGGPAAGRVHQVRAALGPLLGDLPRPAAPGDGRASRRRHGEDAEREGAGRLPSQHVVRLVRDDGARDHRQRRPGGARGAPSVSTFCSASPSGSAASSRAWTPSRSSRSIISGSGNWKRW